MKQNPFYRLSTAAMLGGCYLVSHALKLEPGHLGKLVTLIGVLQLYEGLLLALGVYLVSTGRARRDGAMVLTLETLFLVDAPLLAIECVSADATAGAFLSVALVALAAGKLALVRRALPDALPAPLALLLGLQTALVLGLPVVGSQLAAARLMNPVSFYGLLWLTLALPLVRARMLEDVQASCPGEAPRELRAWTWLPAASVLLHLWAIGWVHQVPFHLAVLTPLLLGLALVAKRDQVVRQVVLPALAVLVSLGQAATLGHVLSTPTGAPVSALQVALVGAGATYAVLGWLHGFRWLVALAALFSAGAVGATLPGVLAAAGTLLRGLGRLVPRSALGWGLTGIVASFVLLAVGAWRSLGGEWPRRGIRHSPRRPVGQGVVTLALVAGFLSVGTALSAFDAHTFGHGRQGLALLDASAVAAAAILLGARARSRASLEDRATPAVAWVGIFAGLVALVLCAPGSLVVDRHAAHRAEVAVLSDIRTIQSAQEAYRTSNRGFPDGRLECLAEPSECLPDYPADGAAFLEGELATAEPKGGYDRSFHPGPAPDALPRRGSPTSVQSFAYVAVPVEIGYTGIRGFCGDSSGHVCFTIDGTPPPLLEDVTCDLSVCAEVE